MTEKILRELIEFIQQASPVAWRILIKQAYVEAMAKALWGAITLTISLGVYNLGRWCWKQPDDDYKFGACASYAISTIVILVSINYFVNATMWFINPEFYVIKWLLQQVAGS